MFACTAERTESSMDRHVEQGIQKQGQETETEKEELTPLIENVGSKKHKWQADNHRGPSRITFVNTDHWKKTRRV